MARILRGNHGGTITHFGGIAYLTYSIGYPMEALGAFFVFWGSLFQKVSSYSSRTGFHETRIMNGSIISSVLLAGLTFEFSNIVPLLITTNWTALESVTNTLLTPVTLLGWIMAEVAMNVTVMLGRRRVQSVRGENPPY